MNGDDIDGALIQNSPEWRLARVGSLGASRVADALARTKSGWGASRANLMAELIAERLTGQPADSYVSPAMQWGTETEAAARVAYEFRQDVEVATIGLRRHPSLNGTHASPDGLVEGDGLIQIKCPNSATHIDTLLGAAIPGTYFKQMQWEMACCQRTYVDFISYDPRLPEAMRLHVRRVPRDDEALTVMEREIKGFLAEMEDKLARIRRYGQPLKQTLEPSILMAG